MKGVVFTEFLELVENQWSLDVVDKIIQEAAPPNGGAYTTVGTYPYEELLTLVGALSRHTQMPAGDLVFAFGKHLFARFAVLFPAFFSGIHDAFEFLENVENVIHVEVRKLYPDAGLPCFRFYRDADSLQVDYASTRPFADLAHGLIAGCVEHFGAAISITRETPTPESGAQARFILRRAA